MAFNTAATNMSLREVRGLAQKLWGQCRDSDSLYRTLAPDVKRTRNLLEDLEEQYTDDDDMPLRLLERLHKCQHSLHRLELTLKAYHTSTHKWQDVKPVAVQELKEGVCGSTQELRAVSEGSAVVGAEDIIHTRKPSIDTSASVPANGDQTAAPSTKPPIVPPRPERAQHPPALTPATAPAEPATPSSASTAHDSVTGFSCSAVKPTINRTPSEEKQVIAGPGGVQHDWRMLYGDPLSVDIAQASRWITGSWQGFVDESAEGDSVVLDDHANGRIEDHVGSGAGNKGLGITGDGELGDVVKEDAADNESFHTAKAPSAATSPASERRSGQSEVLEGTHSSPAETGDEAKAERAEDSRTLQQGKSDDRHAAVLEDGHPTGEGLSTPQLATSPSQSITNAGVSETEQSQLLATFRAELMKRFDGQGAQDEAPVCDNTVQTAARDLRENDGNDSRCLPDADSGTRQTEAILEGSVAKDQTTSTGVQHNEHATTSINEAAAHPISMTMLHHAMKDSARAFPDSDVKASCDTNVASRPAHPEPATPSQVINAPASPPAPARAPPPPPPSSRLVKRKEGVKKRPPPPPPPISPSKARYRVVNTAPPPVQHSEASAEDDLYSSSRPTSPKNAKASHIEPLPIPEVKITECETSEERPRSIVMLTSLKPTASKGSARRRASTNGITHVAFCMAPEVDYGARIRSRKSVDETFKIDSLVPLREVPPALQRSRSVSAPERKATLSTHRPSTPDLRASPKLSMEAERPAQVLEYYGNPSEPIDMTQDPCDLDAERIERICQCWNNQLWEQADAYLMGHLESLIETNRPTAARRVRHLLGVCASFRGQWQRALTLFISVLHTPIKSIDELDAGDCAAAYWLGDTYALMNRRTEALLAYCIAEQHHSSHDAAAASLHKCLTSDQHAVQLGLSKADFKVRWAQEALNGHEAAEDTILHPNIVTQDAARACLNTKQGRSRTITTDPTTDGSRASLLFSLDKSSMEFKHYQRMNLTHQSFMTPYLWPMPYDPTFAMDHVSRGRLIAYECDILEVFRTNPEAKVPRNGPLGLGRMDCFTCNDLEWLIINVRDCLRTLEMDWSEVANVEGVWFLARYHTMRDKIATTDYFSIAIFQQSLRSGYGVEVCPDGISSARLIKCSYEYKRGVEWKAEKRTREYIKRFLDKAYRQRSSTRRESTSRRESMHGKPLLATGGPRVLGRAHTAAVPVTHSSATPPPIPPRPSTTRPPEMPAITESNLAP